jgi:hypothetical protein
MSGAHHRGVPKKREPRVAFALGGGGAMGPPEFEITWAKSEYLDRAASQEG